MPLRTASFLFLAAAVVACGGQSPSGVGGGGSSSASGGEGGGTADPEIVAACVALQDAGLACLEQKPEKHSIAESSCRDEDRMCPESFRGWVVCATASLKCEDHLPVIGCDAESFAWNQCSAAHGGRRSSK